MAGYNTNYIRHVLWNLERRGEMVVVSAAHQGEGAQRPRTLEDVKDDIRKTKRKLAWYEKELQTLNARMSAAQHDESKKIPGRSGPSMKGWQGQLRRRHKQTFEKLEGLKKEREKFLKSPS